MLTDITVEVVYALPNKQYLRKIILKEGNTIETVIKMSGLLELRRDIDLKKNKIGIYGRQVTLTYMVRDGDRVEIYRPIISNPRELYQQRKRIKKQ